MVYTPHATSMLAASTSADEEGIPRVNMAENIPLFLPSSFPSHIQSLPEIKRVCDVEKRLRLAQAEDALVEIRRQRRIVQGLWQFKRINVSGTGNRPNTRMLTLYKRIVQKIERAAQKYRTARRALLVLDPDGVWKESLKELKREDLRGPGKDPEDTKTTNGRFEPSWIWLQRGGNTSTQTEEEFTESIRVEWTKTRARLMRWREELEIVKEEMRRVLAWFEWKAAWWETQALVRFVGELEIVHGASAYARKQAYILRCMAARCATEWLPALRKNGIEPVWSEKYPLTINMHTETAGEDADDAETDGLGDDFVDMIEIKSDDEDDDDDGGGDDDHFEFDD